MVPTGSLHSGDSAAESAEVDNMVHDVEQLKLPHASTHPHLPHLSPQEEHVHAPNQAPKKGGNSAPASEGSVAPAHTVDRHADGRQPQLEEEDASQQVHATTIHLRQIQADLKQFRAAFSPTLTDDTDLLGGHGASALQNEQQASPQQGRAGPEHVAPEPEHTSLGQQVA
eukprot:COSAG02_NODE_28322_length_591_cov_1.945122_1_plen_169_part_01